MMARIKLLLFSAILAATLQAQDSVGGEYELVGVIDTPHHFAVPGTTYTLEQDLERIKSILIGSPPNTGGPVLREETILSLDTILIETEIQESEAVEYFYASMMEKVNTELRSPVACGAVIWMIYNHGFLVKTPQVTMAFDLVDGEAGHWSAALPSELTSTIDVLLISHPHLDHYDQRVANAVMSAGGFVVVPFEEWYLGNVSTMPGDVLSLSGLTIKVYNAEHAGPARMYEVITPGGVKLLHTGDTAPEAIPVLDSLDVLLLNAFLTTTGMRNITEELDPQVMIPGHIHLLSNGGRNPPYRWAFAVDDIPLNSDVMVMAWGEKYQFPDSTFVWIEPGKDPSLPPPFALHQNYPNPFNPASTIRYELPQASDVSLNVYDIMGREVARLVDGTLEPGYHEVRWNAQQFPSGIYIARLVIPQYSKAIKMVLMK